MPSSSATSSSAGVISTDFRNPRTSVNHSRTKRTPRSSTVRKDVLELTLHTGSVRSMCEPAGGRTGPVTERSQSGNGGEIGCPEHSRTVTTNASTEPIDEPSICASNRSTTRLEERDVVYKAEYIWIDGTEPTARLRAKTKILADGADLPIWGFDGSSTNQAPGSNSDCVLKPVFSCPDPIRGGDNKLVMCEVLLPDMTPHPTNTRCAARAGRREVRERRAAVRYRAGVHVLQVRSSARLPRRRRVPGAAGLLLLRHRRRRGLRP